MVGLQICKVYYLLIVLFVALVHIPIRYCSLKPFNIYFLQTRDMVMTKYCGSNRPPLLSWDSPLFIRFESNTNMPGTGFSAVYAMTCKFVFLF